MYQKFVFAAALCWFLAVSPLAAEDAAVALARVLAGKGTITSAEFAAVESAAANDRTAALAAILQRKGVLSTAEAAQFGPAPSVVASAATAPASAPAARTA